MGSAIATIDLSSTDKLLSTIVEAARDPQIDAAKMRELWMLYKDVEGRQAEISFQRAMKCVQDDMKPILRSREANNNKYANLEDIDKALRPVRTKHGFSLTFGAKIDGLPAGMMAITCDCMHVDGFSKHYELPSKLDTGNKAKNDVQVTGSTVTYLRRYLETLIFDLVFTNEHDDDGNGATQRISQEQVNRLLDILPSGWEASLCKFIGVKKLEDIPAKDFDKAYQATKSKVGTKNA